MGPRPVTVLRDGPLGIGSLQAFVDADFEQHYFTLYEDEAHHDALRAMCALDLIGNNTDRKSGHGLLGLDGRIRGIDHGLMFHHEFKLRTVIWEFGGEPVPETLLDDVESLASEELPDALAALLDPFERDAVLSPRTRAGAGGLLPDRRDRPPLSLAARLSRPRSALRPTPPGAGSGRRARPRRRDRSAGPAGEPATR